MDRLQLRAGRQTADALRVIAKHRNLYYFKRFRFLPSVGFVSEICNISFSRLY